MEYGNTFFGWSIKDEISHIAYFDSTALLAATDREAFTKNTEEFLKELDSTESMHDVINAIGRRMSNEILLKSWRKNRESLIKALEVLDPRSRLPWYGPDMSARSFATARLMETWAHGQDVADTLRIRRTPTDRLKHIAHLGVTTFGWSYINRKMEVPIIPIRVELTSPSNELWTWGPEDADNSVHGTAEDFCLVVTLRRHVADTGIVTKGIIAGQWMSIAQAFAGLPEERSKPGQRVVEYYK